MTAPALAEWLMERFDADLEERRGRVARAIASRTAEQAADYESRLEPGTVSAPSGTMTLAPHSDELLFWAGLALAQAGDLEAGTDAVRRAADVHGNWLLLLERLSPDFAPAAAAVLQALRA